MSNHPMTPDGSQLRVNREIKTRGSDLHAPKPTSPPSLKHGSHDIEEADLFSIMSSKDSTAAHSSVFSKRPAHQQQSTSRSTTPDAHDQDHSVHLLAGIGSSYEDHHHRDTSMPVMTHHSPRHDPALCKKSEDSDHSADSSDSETDHDLEAEADRALSEWYGIRLRELPRPFRVVHLFEEVKERCTEILKAEGFGIFLDDNGTPTPEEDEQPAQDGSAESAPTGNPGFSPTLGQFSATLKGKGKCGEAQDNEEDAGDSAGHPGRGPSKIRGPYLERRNPQAFSCPYRKRNPLRFNVSDFEKCANRSFEDISLLKKHCRSFHRIDLHDFFCSKCQRTFDGAEINSAWKDDHSIQRRESRQADPEDGFGEEVDLRLASKKPAERIVTWQDLWGLLFGSQDPVPSSEFEPVHEHHEVARDLASQCHTWPDQFIPILSRWAMRAEWNAWALNSELRRAFGVVLSPGFKDSKALSLEGMTRGRAHPMLLRGANHDQFDPMSLSGISHDRGFGMHSSMETPQDLLDLGSSSLDLGAGSAGDVFEGHGGQHEALMPDAEPTPIMAQPWSNDGFYEGASAWPNGHNVASGQGALTFAAYGGPFDMSIGYNAAGPSGHAGPSNVGKGARGKNRGRGRR